MKKNLVLNLNLMLLISMPQGLWAMDHWSCLSPVVNEVADLEMNSSTPVSYYQIYEDVDNDEEYARTRCCSERAKRGCYLILGILTCSSFLMGVNLIIEKPAVPCVPTIKVPNNFTNPLVQLEPNPCSKDIGKSVF